jgi:hypothetical protein
MTQECFLVLLEITKTMTQKSLLLASVEKKAPASFEAQQYAYMQQGLPKAIHPCLKK